MLYLIGLGLNENGISKEGIFSASRCKKVYLENYTVDFPFTSHQVEEVVGKKVIPANREKVENLSLVDEAKKMDVALLVYGSPLSATTHITLIDECRASGVKYRIVYAASIFDAVAQTGLQIYKFGKTASMPTWQKSFEPESFMEVVKDNMKIDAHSLILIDISLGFQKALGQLEKAAGNQGVKLDKLVVCQALGTRDAKILYRNIKELREFNGVIKPYCIIIPGKLHFVEKEVLESFGPKK